MTPLPMALLPASALGGALFFVVRGMGKFARRRWRAGAIDLALVVGMTLLGLAIAGAAGYVVVQGGDGDDHWSQTMG